MTFYRHFVQSGDFEVQIAAPTTAGRADSETIRWWPMELPQIWKRACRTRMRPHLYGLECLWGDVFLTPSVRSAAVSFNPDAVFTVAGSWDWTALAALKLARTLGKPLIASFNDWYDYGGLPAHRVWQPLIARRFARMYQEADLALCTSEGMREALGPHRNAHVLYPTGAKMPDTPDTYSATLPESGKPLRVLFAGSLGDWYGPMLEALIRKCEDDHPFIEFCVFGSLATWSGAFDHHAKARGIYRGHISFENLRAEAEAADVLLLPMGFSQECAHIERTSFKTKYLDYLAFRRPILAWAPEYSSAVRVSREFGSAECVSNPNPEACADALARLAFDPQRRMELIRQASVMYNDRFRPETIHAQLMSQINELTQRKQASGQASASSTHPA